MTEARFVFALPLMAAMLCACPGIEEPCGALYLALPYQQLDLPPTYTDAEWDLQPAISVEDVLSDSRATYFLSRGTADVWLVGGARPDGEPGGNGPGSRSRVRLTGLDSAEVVGTAHLLDFLYLGEVPSTPAPPPLFGEVDRVWMSFSEFDAEPFVGEIWTENVAGEQFGRHDITTPVSTQIEFSPGAQLPTLAIDLLIDRAACWGE